MLKVGVVGATGYTGEELVRILAGHKNVKVVHLSAVVEREEPISSIFPRLKGKIDIICTRPDMDEAVRNVDLVFLALPHRVSMEMAPKFLNAKKKVVDLSADYRLEPDIYKIWYGAEHNDKENIAKAVYGLPEIYKDSIKKAMLVANPGCYPTSIILAIAPMIDKRIIDTDYIIADSKSGASGAGRRADMALSFGEVNENLKTYKVNEHQHKPEINKILSSIAGKDIDVVFTPHLIPMNRGILSTVYLKLNKKLDTKKAQDFYKAFYKKEPFVRIAEGGRLPQVRDVVTTNFCDIGIKVTGGVAIVVSCIDNLMKGAAGQAVQNMNLMCGFDEAEGLI